MTSTPERNKPVLPLDLTQPEQRVHLDDWFEGLATNEALAAYTFALVDWHFAPTGMLPNLPEGSMRRFNTRWSEVCWHNFHALYGALERGKPELVRDLFAELSAFCLTTRPADPSDRLALILWLFEERHVLSERVLSLLPPAKQAEMSGIQACFATWYADGAEAEEEMRRLSQMGY